jgi:hypothetical protein
VAKEVPMDKVRIREAVAYYLEFRAQIRSDLEDYELQLLLTRIPRMNH